MPPCTAKPRKQVHIPYDTVIQPVAGQPMHVSPYTTELQDHTTEGAGVM